MGRFWKIALAMALVTGATAAAALASDQTIYAAPSDQYLIGDVTIDQGQTVTFTNLDTVAHNVTARRKGPDSKPLFTSVPTGAGSSEPVAGTQYLTTGTYQYVCTFHPWMTGTITVTSSGTPAKRPNSGGSGSKRKSSPHKAHKKRKRHSSHKPKPSPGGGIPQGNGGDMDADNNGGPSDGDGNT